MPWLRRKVERLKPLDEAAAYARCHGDREETVRIVKLPPRRARYDLLVTGEEIRRSLAERLDARDAEPQPSQHGPHSGSRQSVEAADPRLSEPQAHAEHRLEEIRVATGP
jgi:hypothetical protein